MGTFFSDPSSSGLAAALFTSVQQRVLGLLFGQPARRFQSAELIRLADRGTGAVHRQLQRLAAAGLVVVTREGNHKHYQANRAAPIFGELCGLITKTVGLVEPLRRALAPLAPRIRAAFVYGSVASGADTAHSDLDLMVVAEELSYPELFAATAAVEQELGRPLSPTILGLAEWRTKGKEDGFIARVKDRPRLFVLGGPDDLA